MYGIITDAELDRIEQQRESMDSLDWRSPNYDPEDGDRYEDCDANETDRDGM